MEKLGGFVALTHTSHNTQNRFYVGCVQINLMIYKWFQNFVFAGINTHIRVECITLPFPSIILIIEPYLMTSPLSISFLVM